MMSSRRISWRKGGTERWVGSWKNKISDVGGEDIWYRGRRKQIEKWVIRGVEDGGEKRGKGWVGS